MQTLAVTPQQNIVFATSPGAVLSFEAHSGSVICCDMKAKSHKSGSSPLQARQSIGKSRHQSPKKPLIALLCSAGWEASHNHSQLCCEPQLRFLLLSLTTARWGQLAAFQLASEPWRTQCDAESSPFSAQCNIVVAGCSDAMFSSIFVPLRSMSFWKRSVF